jgi:exopolyphosphatase/guanosine-5'-triphosphate,3'-diphosphate pyrophosphatase
MKYFPEGVFTADAFETAGVAAKAVLDDALDAYAHTRWDVAYGASGTVGAVADILGAAGFAPQRVTREGLDWLVDRMLRAQHADRLRLDAMKEDRRPVLAGGVSVLRAVFDLLDVDEMQAAQGALRHGVLYDLLDREQDDTDVRSSTVQRLAARFEIDLAQAQRVDRVAALLFNQARVSAGSVPAETSRNLRKLHWAARLHEIGAQISHSDYHKHGAYILDNADAPGFAQPELHRLSLMVLGHRGKLRKLDADFSDAIFVQQLLALRIAVLLCHARRDPELKGLELRMLKDGSAQLHCRAGWAQAFPQSAHLLREEVLAWQKTPCPLALNVV